MFSQIVNPKTNRKVNINSKIGKAVLRNYINIQSGGKVEWSDRDGFIATGGQATRERSRAEIHVLNVLSVNFMGGRRDVQNYAEFWKNPNTRYPQFGYWIRGWVAGNRNQPGYWNDRHSFRETSLNEFIRHNNHPSNALINTFIEIIRLRFLDSRQRAREAGETRVFHSHSDIIIGMLEAFWTLTETRKNTRLWLNEINFLDIDQTVANHRNWRDISVGLTSSVMNYQLPEAELGQYGEEDELIHAFEGMRM
tara:strand:- start:7493 stop:8248 length:756 start_codon:yes stop_codon:yes gene_type:complete